MNGCYRLDMKQQNQNKTIKMHWAMKIRVMGVLYLLAMIP